MNRFAFPWDIRISVPVEISPSWATWTGKHINYTFDGYDWDTIDGWKEPGEKATWRLDVQEAGTYDVKLSYGCRPTIAGGTLKLFSGTSQLEHEVNATATAEQFEDFAAGTIELSDGEIELTAEVLSTTGSELMRLRSITLERVKMILQSQQLT